MMLDDVTVKRNVTLDKKVYLTKEETFHCILKWRYTNLCVPTGTERLIRRSNVYFTFQKSLNGMQLPFIHVEHTADRM
jgi:hypothetical protein